MVSPSRKVAVVLTVLGIMLLAVSATVLGNYYFGHGRAGRTLSSAPLPPGLAAAPSPSQAPAVSPTAVPERLGVPVTVIVADHHLQAPVSADRLNPDGSLYVPPNPRAVSWSSQDVAPGSGHGTIILVGHVNYGGGGGGSAAPHAPDALLVKQVARRHEDAVPYRDRGALFPGLRPVVVNICLHDS